MSIFEEIMVRYKGMPGGIIQAYHAVQREISCLPEGAVLAAAKVFNIPAKDAHEVATFYSYFSTTWRGKHVIRICASAPCYVAGIDGIVAALEKELGIKMGETTPDGMFTLEFAECVGQCQGTPVITIDGKPFEQVTPEKIPEILAAYPADSKKLRLAVVKHVERQKDDVITFTFSFTDVGGRDAFTCEPGSFNPINISGVGEAPAVISVIAGTGDYAGCAFGTAGDAFDRLQAGDVVKISSFRRVGWPVAEMKGKNLLLIAGERGMALLCPLLQYIRARRNRFGKLEVLYWSPTPEDMIFLEEFSVYRRLPDTRLYLAVAEAPPEREWGHYTGSPASLLDRMASRPENTIVAACGPDRFLKDVVQELQERGWNPEQVYVSLAHRMICGNKQCGKCRIGSLYVCQDGPVFRYAAVKHIFDVL